MKPTSLVTDSCRCTHNSNECAYERLSSNDMSSVNVYETIEDMKVEKRRLSRPSLIWPRSEREIRSQRDVSSRSDMILSIKDRSKLITIDVDDDI